MNKLIRQPDGTFTWADTHPKGGGRIVEYPLISGDQRYLTLGPDDHGFSPGAGGKWTAPFILVDDNGAEEMVTVSLGGKPGWGVCGGMPVLTSVRSLERDWSVSWVWNPNGTRESIIFDRVAPPLFDVEGKPVRASFIQRGKLEIMEDVEERRVPLEVDSFARLHDFVDANEYCGFCEDGTAEALQQAFGWTDIENTPMPDAQHAFISAVQDALHQWLVDGGLRAEMLVRHLRAAYPTRPFKVETQLEFGYVGDGMPGLLVVIDDSDFGAIDPLASSCGRFPVNPVTEYGISYMDALAIRAHNRVTLVGARGDKVPSGRVAAWYIFQITASDADGTCGFVVSRQSDSVQKAQELAEAAVLAVMGTDEEPGRIETSMHVGEGAVDLFIPMGLLA